MFPIGYSLFPIGYPLMFTPALKCFAVPDSSTQKNSGGEGDMDVIITITCYILHIDCLSIALDAHMVDMGPGPGPISIMAERMCIKGNQSAINSHIYQAILLTTCQIITDFTKK